jgi:hypothetical protein
MDILPIDVLHTASLVHSDVSPKTKDDGDHLPIKWQCTVLPDGWSCWYGAEVKLPEGPAGRDFYFKHYTTLT